MTTLTLYGASWCKPCSSVKPILQQLTSENPSVSYQYIDVDQNPSAAQSLGIKSVPVVIVQKNGVETNRFVGAQSRAVYEQAIK